MADKAALLFICMGNICRSPLAEGIFIHKARARGVLDRFLIDSCGTGGWHVGECADPRALEVARKNGVELPSCARQIDPAADFERFDLLLPMDRSNLHHLSGLGAPPDRTRLLRSFDPEALKTGDLDVPDPYWGGDDGFDKVFAMLDRACDGLLAYLLNRRHDQGVD